MNLVELFNQFGQQGIDRIKEIVLASNKNASGKFRDSLEYKLNFDLEKFSYQLEFSGIKYEINIRDGRRKGAKMPPTEPIQAWMKIRGIPLKNTFQVKRAIAEKGIQPFDFNAKAFNNLQIDELAESITEVLQKELGEKIITNNKQK